MTTVAELLAAARARLDRLEPAEALAAQGDGAVLVDIRAGDHLARDGAIPGAVHAPRTVLEWRCDPTSESADPRLAAAERLVLLCDHGYSSSLAAATLLDLGLRATDVVGGFEAWAAAGLPVVRAGRS